MDQSKKKINPDHVGQFNYLGRWVDKSTFCAFVYDKDNNEKLAKSYEEFSRLTESGIYFATKQEAKVKPRKNKNDIIRGECD